MSDNFEFFDKKFIILLVLNESSSFLSIDQIAKMCSDFDDITYFDICEYTDSLIKSGHIYENTENGIKYFNLTNDGYSTLEELIELIPGINMHNIKKILSKQMNEMKKNYEISSQIIPIKHGEYKIACYIRDGNDELLNITLYAGDMENAKNISKNWENDANNIYVKIIEMMTK